MNEWMNEWMNYLIESESGGGRLISFCWSAGCEGGREGLLELPVDETWLSCKVAAGAGWVGGGGAVQGLCWPLQLHTLPATASLRTVRGDLETKEGH